jgi:hypothetical protein
MKRVAVDHAYRLRPDSKGRITLGKLVAEGVSSYRARRQKDGRILLEPFVEVPADERWLSENPRASESVGRGIGDAKAGRLKRVSFKKDAK